jgi:anti-sigma regulatory factor (Ser/Thr protein kinase)
MAQARVGSIEGTVARTSLESPLPRGPEAPWLARRSLSTWFGAALGSEQLQSAKLLASELVTNAVLHGRGQIVLRAHLTLDRLLVEVSDEGQGFEYRLRRREPDALRGRGLGIVDAESSTWGVHAGTARVWFELERSQAIS